MRSCPMERIRAIPQETHNGCSPFPLPRYLSFQCTSMRTGPSSSAPEQFSWTMNRNRVTSCGHTDPLEGALPGAPLLLPQPALSHGDHTPSPTTASPQPRWPHPSNHSQPSATVTTPLLQLQPALSHGGHTEHLCGTWFPPEAEERPTPPQLPAAFSPALIWSALGSPWSLEDLFFVVEYF